MNKIQKLLKSSVFLVAGVFISTAASAENPIFSEVKLGLFDHDANFIGSSHEDGLGINGEVRLKPIPLASDDTHPLLKSFIEPRLTVGGVYATEDGATSHYYGGLTWTFSYDKFFLDFFFGLAGHDGNSTSVHQPKTKSLGCSRLFRESLELGYQITNHHSVSIFASHLSHGQTLCEDQRNAGMDHIGIRYGYKF